MVTHMPFTPGLCVEDDVHLAFYTHREASFPSTLAVSPHSITALDASYPFLPQGFYSHCPPRLKYIDFQESLTFHL